MRYLAIAFLLINTISAFVLAPKEPSQDDFYTPPQGYETQPVGSILRTRNVPNPLTSVVTPIKVQNAWQLLVRSEDSFGNPNAIVTTIIQPFNAKSDKLVSYQTFEDSGKLDCAPSYAIQYGSDITTLATQAEMYYISALLDQGYYVVTPDYEGPKSTFTVGLQSGRATLNSLRATLKSGNLTGIDANAETLLWGYSGGSLASGWAAAIQNEYAPELSKNLLGAALGGFVTNITATAEAVDSGPFAGIISNALAGIGNEYPDFKNYLLKKVSPLLSITYQLGNTHCLLDGVIAYFGKSFFSRAIRYFPDGWSLVNQEPIKTILEDNGLVYQSKDLTPQIPLFIYHGSLDGIVPIVNSRKTFQQWCDWGLKSGEYNEDSTNGHITESIVGAPAALTWIINRFNGQAPVDGCQHNVRTSNLEYPNTPESIKTYFEAALHSIFGFDLGPDVTQDKISLGGLLNLEHFA
ncbi:hypothetical protein CANMA_000777 [Candida margitis]|uniref:uncharacterized protein n=1 Tax=Candida margitis TaxID=1775924 RepID=UPI0022265E79|nr:uncharacterized protein CANMA_000777 [Candida margitis]KAI5970166.1 hypothetical protein CANMA_000777 [Candida margitis]